MDKALLMALFGALLASVGLDPVTGQPRFTFDILVLRDGVGLTPVVIGLFGVSEVLINLRAQASAVFQKAIKGLLPTRRDWNDSILPIARGTILGFLVGAIPGLNVVIATFAAYAVEKRLSKHPEKFGRGASKAWPRRKPPTTPQAVAAGSHCSAWACRPAR